MEDKLPGAGEGEPVEFAAVADLNLGAAGEKGL
jgi:hypothetical protein